MPVPEVMFTVRPRPTSDDPTLDVGVDSLAKRGRSLPPIVSPKPAANVVQTRESIFGDVVFLMRYMIGRY